MLKTKIIKPELLETQIRWLQKLVDGLKTLSNDQFDYSRFVTKYDNVNHCGTVCCAYGWIHKFVPETGVKIEYENFDKNGIEINIWPIRLFSELQINEINFMFYGEIIFNGNLIIDNPYFFHTNSDGYKSVNLENVINRIEHVIDHYTKPSLTKI